MGEDKKLVKEGNELFYRGEYKEALAKYNEALEINKDNEDAREGIRRIKEIKHLKIQGYKLFKECKYLEA